MFFACRTRDDRRYWRMVSASGTIVHRDDLPMLRLIDPAGRESRSIPDDLDLEALFAVAASDIVAAHNQPVSAPDPAGQPALGTERHSRRAGRAEGRYVQRRSRRAVGTAGHSRP